MSPSSTLTPHLSACGLAVLLLTGGAAEGLAQTSTASQTGADRRALLQRHVDAATRAYGAGKYQEALVALREAEAIAEEDEDTRSLASIRFNIARCFEKLGQKAEALEAYRIYDQLPDLPHRKQKAYAATQRLEAAVLGVLAVTCQQAEASVVVLQVSEASSGCPFRSRGLPPGKYDIQVNAPGFISLERSVYVRPGATTAVDFDLSPLPRVTANPTGPITVGTEASPSSSGATPWPWVTMGAGAAGLGVGAVFHALAVSAGDDAAGRPPTARRDQLVSDFEANRDLAYVFYGVGGAVAVAGIVWQILEMTGDGDERVGLRPAANGFEVRF